MTIPKIIHVCWFGGRQPSAKIVRCLASIERLRQHGYEVRLWTDDNYDLDKSPQLIAARDARKWSLVSNYARLDLLHEFGGIYLDSDIEVVRPFDDLLGNDFFIGYIWDCTLGTAAIGASPGHRIVADLLARYECEPGSLISPNNNTVTDYFIEHCPGFVLDGERRDMEGVLVLDKNAFEHPSLFRRSNYTVHHLSQSWVPGSAIKSSMRAVVLRLTPLWAYRKYVCWHSLRISPYHDAFLAARSGRQVIPDKQVAGGGASSRGAR